MKTEEILVTKEIKKKICVIVGASTIVEEDFVFFYKQWSKEYTVMLIAADGGYQFLERQGLQADLVVGDFDSYGSIPKDVDIIKHPVQKDDTDMLLAIKEGIKRECEFIFLFGGLGGRTDHAFANIQLLSYIRKQGARGILFGESMHMTTICNEEIVFQEGFQGIVSMFSIKENSKKITIRNLKYELEEADVSYDFPIGVSNEFVDKESRIAVECGELLIMWERQNHLLPRFGSEK